MVYYVKQFVVNSYENEWFRSLNVCVFKIIEIKSTKGRSGWYIECSFCVQLLIFYFVLFLHNWPQNSPGDFARNSNIVWYIDKLLTVTQFTVNRTDNYTLWLLYWRKISKGYHRRNKFSTSQLKSFMCNFYSPNNFLDKHVVKKLHNKAPNPTVSEEMTFEKKNRWVFVL